MRDIYASTKWRRVRKMVLDRDGHQCQLAIPHVCLGAADSVDHIIPWRDGGAPYSLLNCRAVCRPCNSSRVSRSKVIAGGVNPSRDWIGDG